MEDHTVFVPGKHGNYREPVAINYVRPNPLHVIVNGITLFRDDFKTEEAWREKATSLTTIRRENDACRLQEA